MMYFQLTVLNELRRFKGLTCFHIKGCILLQNMTKRCYSFIYQGRAYHKRNITSPSISLQDTMSNDEIINIHCTVSEWKSSVSRTTLMPPVGKSCNSSAQSMPFVNELMTLTKRQPLLILGPVT